MRLLSPLRNTVVWMQARTPRLVLVPNIPRQDAEFRSPSGPIHHPECTLLLLGTCTGRRKTVLLSATRSVASPVVPNTHHHTTFTPPPPTCTSRQSRHARSLLGVAATWREHRAALCASGVENTCLRCREHVYSDESADPIPRRHPRRRTRVLARNATTAR